MREPTKTNQIATRMKEKHTRMSINQSSKTETEEFRLIQLKKVHQKLKISLDYFDILYQYDS